MSGRFKITARRYRYGFLGFIDGDRWSVHVWDRELDYGKNFYVATLWGGKRRAERWCASRLPQEAEYTYLFDGRRVVNG